MNEPKKSHSNRAVALIGVSKLIEAAMLLIIAFGAHKLLHHDVEATLEHWTKAVRVDPDNRYIRSALTHSTGISEKKLAAISVGTFFYAALFIVEGIGLLREKRWAEYVTVISTAGFLPLEVYELIHKPRLARAVILTLNLIIVAYLIFRLYQTRKNAQRSQESRKTESVTPATRNTK